MAGHPTITETPSTRDYEGVISGALLREIRHRLGHRQSHLAELLGADVDTYQSWEHGRRALGRVPVQRMRAISHGLIRNGADPELVGLLDAAVDVDLSITQILGHPGAAGHPLATWVHTRTWHDLLAWGIAGTTPRALAGGGEVTAPRLGVPVRQALLDRLRGAAEQTDGRVDPAAVLLRRQVYFVASWDHSGAGKDWLARMERRELARLRDVDGWTPTWVAGRSLAVAKAVSGDPGQLRHFITHQLRDDPCEVANLNYWANWSGEDTRPALSDEFMRAPDLGRWRGTVLLRQLTGGLTAATAYVDLTVHTVWALLERRPWLLDDDPALTGLLRDRIQHLLDDHPDRVGGQARRELAEIRYATKMRRSA